MRFPRMTFTVRRLMAVVAILAFVFGAISWVATMRARAAVYWRRACDLQNSTMRMRSIVRVDDGRWVDWQKDENDRRYDEWAGHLVVKYLRLTYYPWRTAEPDPPPPEPLANPRSAWELPDAIPIKRPRPPAWTFLWIWGLKPVLLSPYE